MIKTFIFKINPIGPLHVGLDGELASSDHLVRSDTLFSALVSVAAETGMLSKVFGEDIESSAVTLSSVFPRLGDIIFFPRPFLKPKSIHEEEGTLGRKWKQIIFVSRSVLRRLIEEEEIQLSEDKIVGDLFLLSDEEIKGLKKKPDYILKVDATPANLLDRLTGGSEIFQRGLLYVNTDDNCGLYFMAKLDDVILDHFKELVVELGQHGLGGERSSGKGAFSLESCELFEEGLFLNKGGKRFLTLSLYNPTKSEIDGGLLQSASYECLLRGGWIYWHGDTGYRWRELRMFTEGSVFKRIEGVSEYGRIVDVAPDKFKPRKVFRSGKAFPIFF